MDVRPTPLNVSTYTILVNLKKSDNTNQEIDLHLLSRYIPIYDEKSIQTESMEGCIIGINNFTEHKYTDLPRGKINEKKRYPKSVFNNQLTIMYKYAGFKKVNIKIFSNGKLHLTGINDYPWEVYHVSNFIINLIKNMKYIIYKSKEDLSPLYNYSLIYDNEKDDIVYYRSDIDKYDIKKYIEAPKISEDKPIVPGDNKWLSSIEVVDIVKSYLAYANVIMTHLNNLHEIIVLNDSYSMDIREKLLTEMLKYKNLKSIKKKIVYFQNDSLKIYLREHIDALIKIIKNYIKRLNGLLNTDSHVINKLKETNKSLVVNVKDKYKHDPLSNYYKYKMKMNEKNFNVYNIDIEFIKGEFNTNVGHRLIEMSELLKSRRYNIFNTYNPDNGHAGILVSFYYNQKYLKPGYKPGICYCEHSCLKKKGNNEDRCICLTIVIFRPGNITITSAKNKEQLVHAYNFITQFIEDNKAQVCYAIDKEEIKTSKLKKIIKKEPLFIERDKIDYSCLSGSIECESSEDSVGAAC